MFRDEHRRPDRPVTTCLPLVPSLGKIAQPSVLYPVGSNKFIFSLIVVENVKEEKQNRDSVRIEDFKSSLRQ